MMGFDSPGHRQPDKDNTCHKGQGEDKQSH
jgi:hypothetical protein